MDAVQIKPVSAKAVSNLVVYQVNAGLVTVTGPCYVKATDFSLMEQDTPIFIQSVSSSIAQWWLIEADAASVYRIQFGRPGYVAAATVTAFVGMQPIGQVPRVRIGSSHPFLMSSAAVISGAADPGVNKDTWLSFIPVVAIPGAAVGSGAKASNGAAGALGFNQLVAVAPAKAVYCLFSIWRPACGAAATDLRTPLFIAFKAGDFPDRVPSGAALGIRIGDVNPYLAPNKPFSFLVVVDHSVTSVGYWLPYAELSAGGTDPYVGIDVSVSECVATKDVPFSGHGSIPSGLLTPGMPGFNGFMEAHHGGAL